MFMFGVFYKNFKNSNLVNIVLCSSGLSDNELKIQGNYLLNYFRGYDGVYYTGVAKQNKKSKLAQYETYYQFRIENIELRKRLELIKNKLFTNTKTMEKIFMSSAPYKIWSLISLVDELKRRQVPEKEFKGITDKEILVEILEKLDAKQKKNKADSVPILDKGEKKGKKHKKDKERKKDKHHKKKK